MSTDMAERDAVGAELARSAAEAMTDVFGPTPGEACSIPCGITLAIRAGLGRVIS